MTSGSSSPTPAPSLSPSPLLTLGTASSPSLTLGGGAASSPSLSLGASSLEGIGAKHQQDALSLAIAEIKVLGSH